VIVGLVHPGEMGAALGAALGAGGHDVVWASAERSEATAARAREAGLEDAGSVGEIARRCDAVLSICPPHAALEVAAAFAAYRGLYVDANAIAPRTARRIAGRVPRFVDGGIVGPPPPSGGGTRLYLSGVEAPMVAELFAGSPVETVVVSREPGAASAVKMAFAAWTKGSSALLLATRELARAEGVERVLLEEWARSLPHLEAQSERAARSAAAKGWRWIGEMEEIATACADAGLPDGFHLAAAEVYRRATGEDAGR
jgi:3-hydroxyisobutyrate dehydrogenase-like beta-hydroxyacid dehydrogenase